MKFCFQLQTALKPRNMICIIIYWVSRLILNSQSLYNVYIRCGYVLYTLYTLQTQLNCSKCIQVYEYIKGSLNVVGLFLANVRFSRQFFNYNIITSEITKNIYYFIDIELLLQKLSHTCADFYAARRSYIYNIINTSI